MISSISISNKKYMCDMMTKILNVDVMCFKARLKMLKSPM